MGEQINLVINNLAQKLGVAADKLYPVLIKQAHIEGIMGLLGCILLVVIIIVCVVALAHLIKQCKTCDDPEDIPVVSVIVCCIVTAFSIALICTKLTSSITALCNPDYYVIQMILSQLHQ